MKLYSLSKNKRLIKSTILKINTFNSYLLIGATILVFGGFFYTQEKIIKPISAQTLKTASKISISKTTTNQSNPPATVNLIKLQENLNIKTISLQNKNIQQKTALKNSITDILVGTPMEQMIEPISKQDKLVAAFLVGIALKESSLGKHAPHLNGNDCYNYWGYRSKRIRMGTGGHTCFDSPEDAIETVGKRIHTLAIKQGRNTPQKMLIWKCGSDCGATGGWPAAHKWVKDISTYFNQINNS
jgi:hypothetical protein